MGESVNFFRSVLTVAGLICFLAIVFWAYSKRVRSRFDEAANLPFADDVQDRNSMAEWNKADTQSGSEK